MAESRFDAADRLLQAALELPERERAAFLDRSCGADPELRALVGSLLVHAQRTATDGLATGGAFAGLAGARGLFGGDPTGTSLDRYRIVREIGRGGMGIVYEARDDRLERTVAIKRMSPERLDARARERFLREARAAAALDHPNIVTVHDAGEAGGFPYLVLEYVPGPSLEEHPPESLDEALLVARRICDALEHAHGRGLVHRDLKPANVLVVRGPDGPRVKLTDLGIALAPGSSRVTRAGTILGTPSFLSPEQALGREIDGRADLYSLGVMLYRWATGRLPFTGDDPLALVSQHLHAPVVPPQALSPDLPAGLAEVILRLLAKEPSARYRDAAALRRALERVGSPAAEGAAAAAAATPTPLPAELGAGAIGSLAVLPFRDDGEDSDLEYLSAGLTDGLVDRLARLPNLRVLARSAVLPFAEQASLRKIGEELGVRALVAGRIRSQADGLVIEVELVDAGDGARLWGQRYRCSSRELLPTEERIARELAENLRHRLSAPLRERVARGATENPEAHQAYLKGRHVWSRWKTPEGMKTAIGLFERALELDPLYARAFAGLADSYSVLGNVKALPPGEAYPKARTAAEQGLAIDDTLAELHTSLGFVQRMWEWDWPAAEASYRRAIELNPGYATAYRWYSHLLSGLGRHDEALPVAWRALENDPLSLIIKGSVGDVLFYARRYEEAIALYRETLAVDPNFLAGHTDLARALEHVGQLDEAVAEFKTAAALVTKGPPEPSSGLAHVHARAGRRAEALAIVDELLELKQRRYVSSYGIASVYACLGEIATALDWLERAHDEHDQTLVWVKVHPRLDPLRNEPRYSRLLERMRLDG